MNHIILPTDSEDRKKFPIGTISKEYFPNALAAVAYRSWEGNEKHNPGQHLHWDMDKSSDELDCLSRHTMEEDYDAVVWRALALYEREFKKGWRPKWWKEEWDENETKCETKNCVSSEPMSFDEWYSENEYQVFDCFFIKHDHPHPALKGDSMFHMYQEYVRSHTNND